jgi:hypothetical protein
LSNREFEDLKLMRTQETSRSRSGLSPVARERIFLLSSCATWAALLIVNGEPAKA